MGIGELWDQLVDCICRPPRDDGFSVEDLVGGLSGRFRAMSTEGYREDLVLQNKTGHKLQCSHYIPRHARGRDGRLPCVVYCHCNSGSRRDAEEAVLVLIPLGVSVFTLDFMGSGLSEGNWVTLGCTEVEDVDVVIQHLRSTATVSTIALWGRSMGAVTALLYSQRDPSIAGIVLDSPFSRLTDLILEIVEDQKLPIPRPLCKIAVAAMRRSVRKRANFDISMVAPIDVVTSSFIPALFGHATGDTFIRIAHSEKLHAAYAGDKNLIRFEGDHNSRRPAFFYDSVAIFLHNTMQLELLLVQPGEGGSSSASGGGSSANMQAGVPPLIDMGPSGKVAPMEAGARGASFVTNANTVKPLRLHLSTPGAIASEPEAGRLRREEVSAIDPSVILSHLTPRGANRMSRDEEEVQLAEAMRRSLMELQHTFEKEASGLSPTTTDGPETSAGPASTRSSPGEAAKPAARPPPPPPPPPVPPPLQLKQNTGHHLVPRTFAEEEELLRLTLALSVQEAGRTAVPAGQDSAVQVPVASNGPTSERGGVAAAGTSGAGASRTLAGQDPVVQRPPAAGIPADVMLQACGAPPVTAPVSRSASGTGGTAVPLAERQSSSRPSGTVVMAPRSAPSMSGDVPPPRGTTSMSGDVEPRVAPVAGSWCSWCSTDSVVPPVHKSAISNGPSTDGGGANRSFSVASGPSSRSSARVSLPSGLGAGDDAAKTTSPISGPSATAAATAAATATASVNDVAVLGRAIISQLSADTGRSDSNAKAGIASVSPSGGSASNLAQSSANGRSGAGSSAGGTAAPGPMQQQSSGRRYVTSNLGGSAASPTVQSAVQPAASSSTTCSLL